MEAVNAVLWQPGEQTQNTQTNRQTDQRTTVAAARLGLISTRNHKSTSATVYITQYPGLIVLT